MRLYRAFLFVGLVGLVLIGIFFRRDIFEGTPTPPVAAAPIAIVPSNPVVVPSGRGGDILALPRATHSADSEATDLLSAITPFRIWLDEVNRGQTTDFTAGLTLAVARRRALHQLIQKDPETALRQRIPALQRIRLPVTISGELEALVDTFSQLEVIAICGRQTGRVERFATVEGRRLAVHTYGARVRTVSQTNLPIHGIAIDDQLALAAEPYRLPDSGEFSASGTLGQVQAYVGNDVRSFSSVGELDSWSARQIAAEQQLPSVFGERTLLFLKIDFADAPGAAFTDPAIATSLAEADRYHRTQSANRVSFKTTILPTVLRSAKSKSFYNADPNSYLTLHEEATVLARQYDAANGNSGAYNPDRYQHVVVLFPNISSFTHPLNPAWQGLGDAPGKRVWLRNDVNPQVIAHELGHNLGLQHGHAWKPTGTSPIQPAEHVEYGDPFDLMGGSFSLTSGHFSVPKKRALNYVTDTHVQTINLTGQYRLYRHDATIGANTVALKIDAGTAYDYWLEYRRDVASDLSAYADRVAQGVLIHWNKLPSFTQAGALGTYLLDMTPGSTGGMSDSALVLGQSFYDPTYKIRLTPLQTGRSAQGDWIDVAVALGDRPGNRAPTLQSVSTEATAFARTAVNLTATSNDSDGDTVLYEWDMGDGRPVYTTGAKLSYQWSKGGVFPVSVRAFDIYGGETRQAFNITVRDPLDTWNQISTPGLTQNLKAICFGLGKFVAVGEYVSASSADGIVWSRSTSGNSTFIGNAITASASRFVAVGLNYSFSQQAFFSGIYSSIDGVTWTDASPSRNETLRGVAYGNGRFVAVGDAGIIWSSADGLQWTISQLVSGKSLQEVQFNGSSFLTVGDSGSALLSSDGINWQDKSLKDANTTANGVSFFKDTAASGLTVLNGKWTAMASSGFSDKSGRILWSSDTGSSWSIVSGTYFDLDSTPIKLTAVGGGSTALGFPLHNAQPKFRHSSDGVIWTEKVLGSALAGSLRGGAEGKGRIVLVGEKGQIFATADGLPALAQQPQPQSVNVGQSAVLQVVAYATGPFSYQWRKDGAAISGATSATLSLSNVQSATVGSYSVMVTNNAGFVASNAVALSVNVPPAILLQPSSQGVTTGAVATFTVSASGTAPFSYQWRKDGIAVSGATNGILAVTGVSSTDVGSYSVTVTNAAGSISSNGATLTVNTPPTISTHPISQTALPGATVTLSVVAGGTAPLSYQWHRDGVTLGGATNATLTLSNVQSSDAGRYTVTVTNAAGSISSNGATLTINILPPAISTQPFSQNAVAGAAVTFTAAASGTAPLSYQWRRDGATLTGATNATLILGNVQSTDAGTYAVTITNAAGSSTSIPATLSVILPGRLINLSVLTAIAMAGDDFTLGYVVGGSGTFGAKPLVIRAAGPSLGALGVPGTLDDPKLELFAGSTKTGENDNWGGSPQLTAALAAVGAFAYTGPVSRDAATTASIATRDNSVKVSAVGTGIGTVIAEIYDATSTASFTTSTPRLINVSVRKNLGSGLTMGFVVGGATSARVLVRGIGPTLGAFGVPGTVVDPQLALFNSSSVRIGENNDWGGTAELTAAFASVGAFALPAASKDAALLVTLAPGNYTAQVTGVNGTTGVALVEVYEVP